MKTEKKRILPAMLATQSSLRGDNFNKEDLKKAVSEFTAQVEKMENAGLEILTEATEVLEKEMD